MSDDSPFNTTPDAHQGWASIARHTVMTGICIDWYQTTDDYRHGWPYTVSASREGVLIREGVPLHTIPATVITQADRAFRLLNTGRERDQQAAIDIATHEDDGTARFGRGHLKPRTKTTEDTTNA